MNTQRKWIDITVDFKSGGEQYFAGERLYQSVDKADSWVKAGWAKDLTGEVATGAPDTSPKQLEVASTTHDAAASNA